jgi:hypothetical protein
MVCRPAGSVQVANPFGQGGERDPGPAGLAFGPLVAVDPHLHRVGEVGADLHKARTELLIDDIEVVAGDPPLRLGEGELRQTGAAAIALVAGPHRLKFLGDPDRGDTAAAGGGQPVLVGPHHVDLPVVLGEPHHRDVVVAGEPGHRPPEPVPNLLEDCRRRDRLAQVPGQEGDHLPTHLQSRHVSVEVDPVQALQIQTHVPIQQIVDRRHRGRHQAHLHHRHRWRPASCSADPQVTTHTGDTTWRSEAKPL